MLYSFYSEQLTELILEYLLKQDQKLVFDAAYCSLHQFSNETTLFVSYNQIYADFEVITPYTIDADQFTNTEKPGQEFGFTDKI